MTALRDNRRGIIAMNLAMAAFNLSDALTKVATQTLPLGETIFVRGAFATAAVAAVVIATGTWRQAHRLVDRRMGLRLVGEIGATLFYLAALVHVALPNVSAVFQATPLAMTAAAAVFLGEVVGVRRWAAIAVGFVGVLIIVRPGLDGFEPHSVLVLVSVGFVVVRDISTARLGATIPTSLVTLATAVSVTMLGVVLMPFEATVSLRTAWVWPSANQFGLLAVTAAALLAGYVLLIRATQLAETSAIAPYRYTLLVWAFLYGVAFFDDRPDAATLVGAGIVVATGLYSFRHEMRARAAARGEGRA
ncbi:MAG: DMT family transporter [Siculibacillus sp.]